jgi:hypothetical protein
MEQEIIENIEDNDLIDPIGDLRRALNQEILTREQFHKWTNQLKHLPEFFELAKKGK